jgi:hypothetical protein
MNFILNYMILDPKINPVQIQLLILSKITLTSLYIYSTICLINKNNRILFRYYYYDFSPYEFCLIKKLYNAFKFLLTKIPLLKKF